MSAFRFAGVALLVLLSCANVMACTKTVRWFDDPPYSFKAADGSVAGVDADIAREALLGLGCQTKFVHMPWARALVELEAGRLDVLPSAFRSAQRERFAHFSAPRQHSPNVLYLSAAGARKYRVTALEDLIGTEFRLGVQIGVSYGERFEVLKVNPGFRARLVPVTLRRNAWQMMRLERLDGLIADRATAMIELQQLGMANLFRASPVIVSTTAAGFAFSKASTAPEFVGMFNRELAKMIASGKVRAINQRYDNR